MQAMRTRAQSPGATLSLMVLTDGPEGCAAVDIDSGALVRAHYPGSPSSPLTPFSQVVGRISEEPWNTDPTQPEAVLLAEPPKTVGRVRHGAARRLLRPLLLDGDQHLLGFPGSAAVYWDLRGDRPSMAVLELERPPVLVRRPSDDGLLCRFGWRGTPMGLPVADLRADRSMQIGGWTRLAGAGLARALGFEPSQMVVALSSPFQGRCYKVVTGFLPRP